MTLMAADLWADRIFLGEWLPGGEGERTVVEPSTGMPLGSLGAASTYDVSVAASAAAEAQVSWSARTPMERAAVLLRVAELLRENAAEVQDWLVREAGSTQRKAAGEVAAAAQECVEAASLTTAAHGHALPSSEKRWSFARRRPCGVVGVISPFNVPLLLSMRSVAPALALGNAVLLKPDPRTAVSGGVSIVRAFEEAGLPPGLLSLLPGGADIGEAVVTAREVAVISFTGSTRAGRNVGRTASEHLKRVHLELGGNNALIVLPGADLERAVAAAAFGSFFHQGQICMTTGRHLVHESLATGFVELLAERADRLSVGNPALQDVALGPLIDVGHRDRVHDAVTRSADMGARVRAGGTFSGLHYRPTVLSDVTPEMPAFAEEVFGPVAPVLPFQSTDEAIKLAGNTDYGLSLGILGDVGAAMEIADSVPSGIVHINDQTVSDEPNVPFGGVRRSGTGSRIGGDEANLQAFTEMQWLTIRPDIAERSL